jgi:hypothetical protein
LRNEKIEQFEEGVPMLSQINNPSTTKIFSSQPIQAPQMIMEHKSAKKNETNELFDEDLHLEEFSFSQNHQITTAFTGFSTQKTIHQQNFAKKITEDESELSSKSIINTKERIQNKKHKIKNIIENFKILIFNYIIILYIVLVYIT